MNVEVGLGRHLCLLLTNERGECQISIDFLFPFLLIKVYERICYILTSSHLRSMYFFLVYTHLFPLLQKSSTFIGIPSEVFTLLYQSSEFA